MLETCDTAFKEWAAVGEALAQGLYLVSLRKGGIHEKRGEFTLEHRNYFLFPTYAHQKAADLVPAVLPHLERVQAGAPAEDAPRIALRYYVEVVEARYLTERAQVLALEGLHPFSTQAVEMRFDYKKPGLWAMVERLYRLPQPLEIENGRKYAGCRSWVPLAQPLSTAGALPVLAEPEFQMRLDAVRTRLPA